MKRNRLIDLTPLLDVILILLFLFIFNATYIEEQDVAKIEELKNEVIELKEKNQELLQVFDYAKNELSQSNNKLAEVSNELDELKSITDIKETNHNLEKETIEQITIAMQKYLGIEEEEFKELLSLGSKSEQEELINAFSEIVNQKDVLREMSRYLETSSKFIYFDVLLATENNRIYINNQDTFVSISRYDVTGDEREDKIEEIKAMILSELSSREGGFSLSLITYGIMDEEVYQFAYRILEEALFEVREIEGTNKVFLAEYNFVGGE